MRLKFVSILLCLFFSVLTLSAQLVTNNSKTPNDLVRNVLTGGGVVISNVTFTGSPLAIGEFFGASSNIGLNNGIIMSTGSVLDEVDGNGRQKGPVGPNNSGSASESFKLAGDADLSAIYSGLVTKDAAILEFDFVPEGDTVKFRYVFASEEYPEWVKQGKNDAFAFFISGPGIVGKKNIALLPDGVTPVSIDNVNGGRNNTGPSDNPSYYINNGNGSEGTPQFTNSTVVNYDGFTVVLEAVSKVTPCSSYHLKLVIADGGGDELYDSGVFLEANSLNSEPKFKLDQQVDFSPNSNVNEVFEACSKGELSISRTSKLTEVLVVPFTVMGTATEGADYTSLPRSVTFLPGETSKVIEIVPLQDATLESDETVILEFDNPSICAANKKVQISYTIKDQPALTSITETVDVVCSGDNTIITTNSSGGVPVHVYVWDSGEQTSSKNVAPLVSTYYPYTVLDGCGQSKKDSVLVNVPVYPALVVNPMTDVNVRCKGAMVDFTANPVGGAGGFIYDWSSGENTKTISKEILQTDNYRVKITDKCGSFTDDDVAVTLNYPVFSADAGKDTAVCVGVDLVLTGSATGGYPPYSYFWEGAKVNPYDYKALKDKDVLLSVFDSCGIIPAIDQVFIGAQKPTAQFNINAPLPEPNELVFMQNYSSGATSYIWDFGNGLSSTLKDPKTTYREIETFTITLIAEDDLNCLDSTSKELKILQPFYFYIPNSFTPGNDGLNEVFIPRQIGTTEFLMMIYNRWGERVFTSTDPLEGWDGKVKNGNYAAEGVYVVKIQAKSIYRPDKEINIVRTVTLVR